MRKILMTTLLLTCLFPVAWAKRIPAPKVEPIIHNGIRFLAPNDNGRREYIQTTDAKSGKLLKEVTVKRNFIWFWIEEDIQWIYISNMEIHGDYLVVIDEANRCFELKLPMNPIVKVTDLKLPKRRCRAKY